MSPSVALLLGLALHPAQSPTQPDFPKAWDAVQAAIRQRYYARETRKTEMEGHFARFATAAKSATSISAFGSAVNAMIEQFKDSHFALFTKEDQGYYAMDGLLRREPEEMPHVGAWFRKTERGYQVQMVLNGMAAEKAGIRKGEFVTAVDGKPFSPVASLMELVGKRVSLTVRDAQGKERRVEAAVVKQAAPKMFLDATNNSARVIERDGKKLAYLHLWTQANDDFRNAVSNLVYGRFRDTDGFILDLRDGFGGRPEGFADPFSRPEVSLEWQFGATAPKMKQLFGYQRPLVVIINEGSRSAKEVLSYILKSSGRATLRDTSWGRRPCGSTTGHTWRFRWWRSMPTAFVWKAWASARTFACPRSSTMRGGTFSLRPRSAS
jgi:carboxyl-terminal processing protease